MVLARMVLLMAMWLRFHRNIEIFASLHHGMNQCFFSIRPFIHIPFIIHLVVLSERFLCYIRAEQSGPCGSPSGCTGSIGALYFGRLNAADVVSVVVNRRLEDFESVNNFET